MLGLLATARSAPAILLAANDLILVHENGHYFAARMLGVRALRFCIGFGPTLFQRADRHGYALASFAPALGAYVALADENDPLHVA